MEEGSSLCVCDVAMLHSLEIFLHLVPAHGNLVVLGIHSPQGTCLTNTVGTHWLSEELKLITLCSCAYS